MQEQGRKALAYVSSLRVISGIALVPTTSGVGEFMSVPLEGNWFGKNSTCAVYSKDRNKVTTLKGVGQSHPHRNMLSACDIVLSFRKKNHNCYSKVCLLLVFHKETDGSLHSESLNRNSSAHHHAVPQEVTLSPWRASKVCMQGSHVSHPTKTLGKNLQSTRILRGWRPALLSHVGKFRVP